MPKLKMTIFVIPNQEHDETIPEPIQRPKTHSKFKVAQSRVTSLKITNVKYRITHLFCHNLKIKKQLER